MFQTVQPNSSKGRKYQQYITIYTVVLAVFGLVSIMVPGSTGFVNILIAGLLYLSNNSCNHIFLPWLVLLTFSPVTATIENIGLHWQRKAPIFSATSGFSNSLLIFGCLLYFIGIPHLTSRLLFSVSSLQRI